MDVPAWAFPNLCIGRTYDAKNNRAGIDIFQTEIKTKSEQVKRFSFQYKFIESKEDVRDLLNISGDISLKIKANIFKVEGAGKYINNNKKDKGVSEILAVMKCTTENKTMDGSCVAKPEMMESPSLGTHYVRSVTYGAEMIASLKFKSTSSSEKLKLNGKSEGGLDIVRGVTAGLEAQLKRLTSDGDKESGLSIEYYATDLPDKNPTNVEDLVKLIQEFPSRLKTINNGLGVPIKIELQPIESVYPKLRKVSSVQVMECEINDIESRLDDLYEAQRLVSEYKQKEGVLDSEMKQFNSVITKTLRKFVSAISSLDKKNVEECLDKYAEALDGNDYEGKFEAHWREMLMKKKETVTDSKKETVTATKPQTTDIKLPDGKELTIVLLGKTGNGKSATGNRIIGERCFDSTSSSSSATKRCGKGTRTSERHIFVIDTPGVLDTSTVKRLRNLSSERRYVQKEILKELHKIFSWAPTGFDAIMLVVKFGCRFTDEDGQALRLLIDFLGKKSLEYMILTLTYADQVKNAAEEENMSEEDCVSRWKSELPEWVKEFINDINDRVVLFDNTLTESKDPTGYKKQLTKLIEVIDKMNFQKSPFINNLTNASVDDLEEHMKKALDSSGFSVQSEKLEQEKRDIEDLLKEKDLKGEQKVKYETMLKEVNDKIDAEKRKRAAQGGCFPGSSTFTDEYGLRREMHSLKIGEKVQVAAKGTICLEPVITFIHREQEKLQDFLSITTTKSNSLKMTEDHLLFVEKNGLSQAIPARDVRIGDTVYVKQDGLMRTATVQDISTVYEKGVYAPVTRNGTILINDVHTSCYFDVLSHKWSHRAMGVLRAAYHVSPEILWSISGFGEKDGFPGWCRLARKILT